MLSIPSLRWLRFWLNLTGLRGQSVHFLRAKLFSFQFPLPIRTIAQHEHLSETGLERIEKAERVAPKMQATIEFVSGYVHQQVRQLDLTQPASYTMHAQLIPSYYLDRVASTRTVTQGEPLRELAAR